jgi:hypothetical protein
MTIEKESQIIGYGVFCESLVDCEHKFLRYISKSKIDAEKWAKKHDGVLICCVVRELKYGEFST